MRSRNIGKFQAIKMAMNITHEAIIVLVSASVHGQIADIRNWFGVMFWRRTSGMSAVDVPFANV